MANYVSLESNNTPLNIEKLEKGYNSQIGELFQSSSKLSQGLLSNGLVILSVVIFALTLVYSTQGQFLTSNTKAENIPTPANPTPRHISLVLNPIVSTIKEYPMYYRDVSIAEDIYEDLKTNYDTSTSGKKNYMIDKIVRFYIYRAALQQKGVPYQRSEKEGPVANMLEDVTTMEQVIAERKIEIDIESQLIHFK